MAHDQLGAGAALGDLGRAHAQLALEDLHDLGRAEATLAAAHAAPVRRLMASSERAGGHAMDDVHDLRLAHAAAAADDVAVGGVLLAELVPLVEGGPLEVGMPGRVGSKAPSGFGEAQTSATRPETMTPMAGALVRPGLSMAAQSKKHGAPSTSPITKSCAS